jgi:oligoribonuclease NrnB/cAMP/cGMP phosphodiesterase (DHH superfamily)
MPTTVLYHAACDDGFCAAWVARQALPRDTEFIPVQYNEPPPEIPERRSVFILDFSYPVETLLAMKAMAARGPVVIDHHVTARERLARYRAECREAYAVFSTDKSGAQLTWEYFFPEAPQPPWLVSYTQDRDLWRWQLPHSRAISAALRSYPRCFDVWDELATIEVGSPRWRDLVTQGAAILRYQEQVISGAVKSAVEVDLGGYKVLAVNATQLQSEIGERLAAGRPFGATFFIRADGARVWSLRSREGGVDVSKIAKARGGGGHPQAAGFTEALGEGV